MSEDSNYKNQNSRIDFSLFARKKDRLIQITLFALILIFSVCFSAFAQNTDKEFYEEFKNKKISVSFKNTDIDDVIKIFSKKMKVNIIRNDNVKAKITADLQDVSVLDALEIICRSHNINYLVERFPTSKPMIRIYNQKEYLKALMYKGKAEVIRLKYTKALDIYKKLQESGAINKEAGIYDGGIFYADEDSNSIIVVDKYSTTNTTRLREVIKAFDQPTPQVLIEAKILSVALSDSAKYGINWGLIWGRGKTELSMPFSGDTEKEFSIKKIWKLKDKSGTFTGMLTALEQQGDVKILSNPRIVVLNNEDAMIIEGKNEPYNLAIIVPSTSGENIIQTKTEFIEVGIGLTVTPQVNEDNVILKIKPTVSSAADRQSLYDPPTVSKSEAETTVSVKNKSTLVLGGLIQTRKEKVVKKIPLLGSIPLLGYLFSSRS